MALPPVDSLQGEVSSKASGDKGLRVLSLKGVEGGRGWGREWLKKAGWSAGVVHNWAHMEGAGAGCGFEKWYEKET